jgi:predicted kinase
MQFTLILLRGLPGAGKSSLAKVLAENKWPVFSVDDYFTDAKTGVYRFEFDKNHLAYKACEENCRQAMEKGIEKLFMDNTFTLDWELKPYFKLASEFNYTVFVCTVENYHLKKNTHGISDEQIKKMADKYKVKLF